MRSLPDLETPPFDDATVSRLLARTLERSATLSRRHRRRHVLGASVGALALAAAVLLATLPGGSPPPRTSARVAAFALVGDLTPGWHVASSLSGVSGFSLSCPSTATCYASDQSAPSDTVQVTRDGGTTWTATRLPEPLVASSSITCPTPSECAILGIDGAGSALLVRTDDGGATWTATRGPAALADPAAVITLGCSDATTCAGIASVPGAARPLAFATRDGGASWQTAPAPEGFVPVAIRCPSSSRCVATGFVDAETPSPSGAVLYSDDGGATWARAALPDAVGARSSLACATASTCLATFFDGAPDGATSVLRSDDGGTTWHEVARAHLQLVAGLSCPTTQSCTAGGVALATGGDGSQPLLVASGGVIGTSDDGGASFTQATIPSSTTAVLGVSCPDTTTCFALAFADGSTNGAPPAFELLASGPAAAA